MLKRNKNMYFFSWWELCLFALVLRWKDNTYSSNTRISSQRNLFWISVRSRTRSDQCSLLNCSLSNWVYFLQKIILKYQFRKYHTLLLGPFEVPFEFIQECPIVVYMLHYTLYHNSILPLSIYVCVLCWVFLNAVIYVLMQLTPGECCLVYIV